VRIENGIGLKGLVGVDFIAGILCCSVASWCLSL